MNVMLIGLIGASAAVVLFCFLEVMKIEKRIEEFENNLRGE